MKTFVRFFMMLGIAAAFSSCIKDEVHKEYVTYQGAQNYVYDFVINQRDWKFVADANHPDEKFYECTIKMDGLTEECYNFGQVCLYQDFDGYQQMLPVTRHRNDGEFVWTETTDCTFTVGSVTVYFTSNDFAEVLPDPMYFRAVLTYEKTK